MECQTGERVTYDSTIELLDGVGGVGGEHGGRELLRTYLEMVFLVLTMVGR